MLEGLTVDDIARVRVTASGIPVGQKMQLYYSSEKCVLSETHSLKVESTTTNETEFVFDLRACTDWKGSKPTLRLDPLQVLNTSFTIKSITIDFFAEGASLCINGVKLVRIYTGRRH